MTTMMTAAIAAALLIALSIPALVCGTPASALDQIAPLIDLKPGSVVAEIGAGSGAVSVAAARRLGPGGHVYASEIDPKGIKQIRKAVAKAGLDNVTVMGASADDTHLSAACCDAIWMIGVYHHFTDPEPTDASIFRALKPGGRLAIIDFRPTLWLWLFTPKGIPANRGGHGMPLEILEDELKHVGFQIEKVIEPWGRSWFRSNYCVVSRKPS